LEVFAGAGFAFSFKTGFLAGFAALAAGFATDLAGLAAGLLFGLDFGSAFLATSAPGGRWAPDLFGGMAPCLSLTRPHIRYWAEK
jgi:hypothetical protein